MLLPTSLVGSYPQPDWLIDRARLAKQVPRVRATDLWLVDRHISQVLYLVTERCHALVEVGHTHRRGPHVNAAAGLAQRGSATAPWDSCPDAARKAERVL